MAHLMTSPLTYPLSLPNFDRPSITPEPEMKSTLEKFYGPNWFKCPRINCQYFYKGFSIEEHRKQHVDRHERAFLSFLEGCPTATFGCTTSKELEDHMSHYHGINLPDGPEFPEFLIVIKRKQIHPSTFQCTLCPEVFTRNHNLMAHLRMHTNEKPFVRDECGLSFARSNDWRRHQRLHSGESAFVCKGSLTAGGKWGCGLRFPRADKLGAHHRSALGVRCIKPLLEEKAEVKKRLHEEQNAIPNEITEIDRWLPQELPLLDYPLLGSPSPESSLLPELLTRPGLPASNTFNQNDGFSPAYPKVPYQRPNHDRVFCKLCDEYPEGFCGVHELSRHQDRNHKVTIKKWVCIEPSDITGLYKPVVPLSKCRACAHQKTYGAYYNAAAHLRRAHFKPKARNGNKKDMWRGGMGGGDWPPMLELKRWMKHVTSVAAEEADGESSHEDSQSLQDSPRNNNSFEVHPAVSNDPWAEGGLLDIENLSLGNQPV